MTQDKPRNYNDDKITHLSFDCLDDVLPQFSFVIQQAVDCIGKDGFDYKEGVMDGFKMCLETINGHIEDDRGLTKYLEEVCNKK